ncbi:MAG: ethylbenzene dehydrogenase-related protein [Nitrospinaceae bacterium]|nr:ethylbenzene dehydrogenase-related protein [Nitrospinaceae bacterium]
MKNSKLIKALIVAFTLGMFAVANAADIKAVKVTGSIPTNSDDPFWSERYGPTALKHVIIDMDPQMITNPMWPNPSTKYVFAKAATNGKEIAVHLEYNDPTRNDIMVQSQQYKDQVAIMFPVNQSGEEPPFTMGGDGERVNIWQWKATWDKEGRNNQTTATMQDMEDQYAYMAMGSGSYYMYEPDGKLSGIDTVHGKPGTKTASQKNRGAADISKRSTNIDFGMGKNEGNFNPGRATGNILSDAQLRVSAVEDLNAEGFSTLTTQAHQDVDGSGNWRNNRWAVVFKRNLSTSDQNDTQFSGSKTPMAIAIWNGGNKERNGQKAVTQWNTLHY